MSSSSSAKLFQPIQVGDITLNHRVALAPLTRFRANKEHVHGDLAVEYYNQRASTPGTLLITEGTFIAAKAGGYANVPGIYTQDQIVAWKKVTDVVHAKGSFIYLQLWALGRSASEEILRSEDQSFDVVSSSDVKLSGITLTDLPDTPRPLTIPEIQEYVELYAKAASNAVHGAGFDGVEILGANGYLIDQFIQDMSNKRTDEYGGSVENRSRFALEVVEAVAKAVGPKKTAIRLSPWTTYQDMGMSNPIPTYTYLVTKLRDSLPDLSYIHVPEARIWVDIANPRLDPTILKSNDFIRELWAPRPYISAGAYPSAKEMFEVAETKGDIIAIGRYFISNPDLPERIKSGIAWTSYGRSTFYVDGNSTSTTNPAKGYVDYPRADASITGVA